MPASVLLLAAAAAQTAPAPAGPQVHRERDVVVTGTRLEDSERAWKQCRAEHCLPDQEIEAALAHGENLFVAGDYGRSRVVLRTTINNTRGAAKRFPVQVGDLRRAEARVASHLGEDEGVRRGMQASRDALASGLGASDPRVLAQRLQIADAMMLRPPQARTNIGDARPFYEDWRQVALRTYRSVAKDAHRLDLPDIEGRALARAAVLLTGLASGEPQSYKRPAREAIAAITRTTDPRLAPFRDAARVLTARLDFARDGERAVDRLVASYEGERSRTPVLLFAPPIDWSHSRDRAASLSAQRVAQNSAQQVDYGRGDQWVDIAFRIGPTGRVKGAEILRESGGDLSDWIGPVLDAVRARRYAPPVIDPGTPGQLRVERHTYTASNGLVAGSKLRAQTGIPRVVVTDMTIEQPGPAPAS